MNIKKLKAVSYLLLLVVTLTPTSLAWAQPQAQPQAQATGTNLLVNPGFEGIGKPIDNSSPNPGNWTRDTFTGQQFSEIFTPQGWVTWWQGGEFKRPECKVIPNEAPFNGDPSRIYDGYYSGMCFTFYGKQNAGYFQVVRNLPPHAVVQGSIYAHAWACGDDDHAAHSCGDPDSFYFQVGIDPTGGTDPFSPNIVWSAPAYNYDTYKLVGPVQATVGDAGVVTFFTRAFGKWQLKHNDAYWDDASLVLISGGETATPTAPPPPPTSSAPPAPVYTPTPLPDGSIVYIVQPGDTLFGIALTYGVSLDDLRRLNAGTLGPNDLLSIGQKVVIAASPNAVQVTPTPAVQPTAAPTQATAQPDQPTAQPGGNTGGQQQPAQPPQPAAGTGSLCVLAFKDANGDMIQEADQGEERLPGAQFTLLSTGGPVGNYTTDGMSEPYCFENLAPGNYILRHTPPQGYTTDLGPWSVIIEADKVASVNIGYVPGGSQAGGNTPAGNNGSGSQNTPSTPAGTDSPTVQPATDAQGNAQESDITSVLNIVLKVSGVIALLLVIAVGVLFYLSRR